MQLILKLVLLSAIIDCLIAKPAQKKSTNAISAATTPSCECVSFLLCENGTQVINDAELIDVRFGITTNINSNQGASTRPLCDDLLEICCEPPNMKPRQIKNRPSSPQVGSRGCGVRNFDGVDLKIMSRNKENEVKFGEFPWMVVVLLNTPDELDYVYLCGGTLIHRKVVLTAAHCVYGKNATGIKIRAGEWDTQSTNENLEHQDRAIEAIITHERYHPKTLQNDFALLMLSDCVNIEDNVDIICLPETTYDFDVTGCATSGWGQDMFEWGHYQEILKKIELSVIDPSACQRTLRRTKLGKRFKLDQSFVCAGGVTGEDMCRGDGGSPLICPLKTDPKRYVQVGIVSWGIKCGSDVPGVYASVLHARPWIDNQLLMHNLDNTIYQHQRYT